MKTEWQRQEPIAGWWDFIRPHWLVFFVPRAWRRRQYRWISVGAGATYSPTDDDVGGYVRAVVTAPNSG